MSVNKPNTGSKENILCFVNDMDGDNLIPTFLWLLHLMLLYLVCSWHHCITALYDLLLWKQCMFECLTVVLRGSKQLNGFLAKTVMVLMYSSVTAQIKSHSLSSDRQQFVFGEEQQLHGVRGKSGFLMEVWNTSNKQYFLNLSVP